MTLIVCKSTVWKQVSSPYGIVKDRLPALNLHTIPGIGDDPSGASNGHTQRFKIIDKATPPAWGPIARELRSAAPELFIISTMSCFSLRYRLDPLVPALQRLILRKAACQHHMQRTASWRCSTEHELTW